MPLKIYCFFTATVFSSYLFFSIYQYQLPEFFTHLSSHSWLVWCHKYVSLHCAAEEKRLTFAFFSLKWKNKNRYMHWKTLKAQNNRFWCCISYSFYSLFSFCLFWRVHGRCISTEPEDGEDLQLAEFVEVCQQLQPEALELPQDVVVLPPAPQGEVALLQLPGGCF